MTTDLRSRRAVVAGLLAVASTACSPSAAPMPQPEPPPSPPSLGLSLSQPRWDEGTRTLRVAVINDSAAPVNVTSATVSSAAFEEAEVSVVEGPVDPGRIAGFTLEYGEPRCADAEVRPIGLTVIVDGAERVLPLNPDEAALLERLHDQECAQQRLDAAVSVSLALDDQPVVLDGEEYLSGSVVLRRVPQSADPPTSVTLTSFRGSVLLSLELDRRDAQAALPATLAPSAERLDVPVLVGSEHRCDPHALTNSSQTYLLSSFIRLPGHPVQRVITVPGVATRNRLAAIIDRDCAGG